MQGETARHGPMVRCTGLSDRGLRSRQALGKYEVKGGVREAMRPRVSYALR